MLVVYSTHVQRSELADADRQPAHCADGRALAAQADEVRAAGGEAWLLHAAPVDASESAAWCNLFDRSADYAALIDLPDQRSIALE